jgi:hypothetical protein
MENDNDEPVVDGGYAEFEAVYGGCDAKYGMGGAIAIALLIVVVIIILYVINFMRDAKLLGVIAGGEGFCNCAHGCSSCAAEGMKGAKNVREITPSDWSRVMQGM